MILFLCLVIFQRSQDKRGAKKQPSEIVASEASQRVPQAAGDPRDRLQRRRRQRTGSAAATALSQAAISSTAEAAANPATGIDAATAAAAAHTAETAGEEHRQEAGRAKAKF